MIAREYGRYVLVCDCCGTEIEGFTDFDDVLEFKNREGWTSQRGVNIELKDDWMDICDKCSKKDLGDLML